MPTTFDGSCVEHLFEKAFGFSPKELTIDQAWFLTKLSKHIRTHCKSNNKFNEYMNRNFPNLNFGKTDRFDFQKQIPYVGLDIQEKEKERTNGNQHQS